MCVQISYLYLCLYYVVDTTAKAANIEWNKGDYLVTCYISDNLLSGMVRLAQVPVMNLFSIFSYKQSQLIVALSRIFFNRSRKRFCVYFWKECQLASNRARFVCHFSCFLPWPQLPTVHFQNKPQLTSQLANKIRNPVKGISIHCRLKPLDEF